MQTPGLQTAGAVAVLRKNSAAILPVEESEEMSMEKITITEKQNHAETPPDVIKAGGWAHFGKEAERLCREHGREFYIKDDLRAEMERA